MNSINPHVGTEHWEHLSEFEGEFISPGAILRCSGKWPYEDYVDFMAVDLIDQLKRGFGLIVASGFKAGRLLATFPSESRGLEMAHGLKAKWLIENWAEWAYPDCPIEQVLIRDRFYPAFTQAAIQS
ncbi:Imm45 family immunity protein [Rhizobium lusitanum]|uniref:Immunity protein 45 domain-containing protein n=1 Tax=Rhizobium lusitanum TaxID=293958 RepID=A0A7X0IV71_9HYPH|nr:Imm45 family immunity protein [Rhizobium lusitanum]MBB6487815.1 hypothetical protein [Rhizobium lusitanum]